MSHKMHSFKTSLFSAVQKITWMQFCSEFVCRRSLARAQMLSEKGDGGLFLFQLVTILKSIFFSCGNKKKLTNCSHICSASFCYGAFIRAANAAEEGERKAVYKQDAVTLTQWFVSVTIFGSCHLILLFVNSTDISKNLVQSL